MNRAQAHIEFIDYLRAIAIIAVFLFHLVLPVCGINILPWGTWLPKFTAPAWFWPLLPVSFGWCGVAIFFVVSGFCIHLSFKRKPDWLDFASRRFFRIYPAYVIALLLFAFTLPWTRISASGNNTSSQLRAITSRERRPCSNISPTMAKSREVRKLDQNRATSFTERGTMVRLASLTRKRLRAGTGRPRPMGAWRQ